MKTLNKVSYLAALIIIGLLSLTSNISGQKASQSKSSLEKTPNQQKSDEYLEAAIEYLTDGKLDLAIATFTKAIQMDQKNAEFYSSRSQAYKKMVKHDLAAEDLAKFKELSGQK